MSLILWLLEYSLLGVKTRSNDDLKLLVNILDYLCPNGHRWEGSSMLMCHPMDFPGVHRGDLPELYSLPWLRKPGGEKIDNSQNIGLPQCRRGVY